MAIKNKGTVLSWCLYDWANSAFAVTVMAGFFPLFFKQFWSAGVDSTVSTARLGLANSIAGLTVALSAPVLGAIADKGGARKKFLFVFALVGITCTAALFLVEQNRWLTAMLFYILATIGFSGGNIFYDALIMSVASDKKMHMVSALGFALGYLGGGLLFALNVWMTMQPELFGLSGMSYAVRISFLLVAFWWALFSVPLFLFVKEPVLPDGRRKGFKMVNAGFRQLSHTFKEIRHLKQIFLFLAAYWLYIDGVDTIVRMAVDYGASIGIDSKDLIKALLIIQFEGFPAAVLFGKLGEKIGAKKGIFIAIGVYFGVTLWGAFMRSSLEFYGLALVIGLVQGGIQALSRSFYARIIPADKSAEYFGFYNMLGKFAVVIGPVLMGYAGLMLKYAGLTSESAARGSIISITLLFLAGAALLFFVDENKARQDLAFLK